MADELVTRSTVEAMITSAFDDVSGALGRLMKEPRDRQDERSRASEEAPRKADFLKAESDDREAVHANTMATLDAKVNQVGLMAIKLEEDLKVSVNEIVEELKSYAAKQRDATAQRIDSDAGGDKAVKKNQWCARKMRKL